MVNNMLNEELFATKLIENSKFLLYVSSLQGGSSLTLDHKNYANDLIDRYTTAWRTPSRPTSNIDPVPKRPPSRQLFADESKYVDELINKYAAPNWSLS